MSITYDASFAKYLYAVFAIEIEDVTCPFCNDVCTEGNFGGAIKYDDTMRLIHKDVSCLMGYAKYMSHQPKQEEEV